MTVIPKGSLSNTRSLELNTSVNCPVSPWLTCDEAALKSFAKCFLDPSHEDRAYAEKITKLRNP